LDKAAEEAVSNPLEYAWNKVTKFMKVKSPSQRMVGLGKDIQDGLLIGLGGKTGKTPIEMMFDRLVESTDEWTKSLQEAANAAGNVAAAVGGDAAGGGGGSRIKLELDGEVLAEYILDTVKGTMRREARG